MTLAEWRCRRAARRALSRMHGVPYADELTPIELRGMASLERSGDVERDIGMSGRVHWHRARNRLGS